LELIQKGAGLPVIVDILSYLSVPEIATLSTRGALRKYLEGYRENEEGVEEWHEQYEAYYSIPVHKYGGKFVDETAQMLHERDAVPRGKRVNFFWLMLAKWGADKILDFDIESRDIGTHRGPAIDIDFLHHGNNRIVTGFCQLYQLGDKSPLGGSLKTLKIKCIRTGNTELSEMNYMKVVMISMCSKEGLTKITYDGQTEIRFDLPVTVELIMRIVYRFLTVPRIFLESEDEELMRSELK